MEPVIELVLKMIIRIIQRSPAQLSHKSRDENNHEQSLAQLKVMSVKTDTIIVAEMLTNFVKAHSIFLFKCCLLTLY